MKSLTLHCSPLTVNKAWKGKRFKTSDYEAYEKEVANLIPFNVRNNHFDGLVEIEFRFHLKYHKITDYDNLLKPLQDILVKCGVIKDDRFIYRAVIEKIPAKVDYIEIEIKEYVL